MLRTTVVALALAGLLLAPVRASAQPTQKLFSQSASGTITTNGGTVEMQNAGGLGSIRVQSSGTYTGTWEMQCSVAPTGITPVYDADDELNMTLDGASSAAVQSVTDSVAVWSVNIAGCTAVRAISTSSMTGSLVIYMYATTTGGGSSGGGGGSAPAGEGATGSAVPASASYNGINVSGTLRGETGLGVGSHFAQTVAIVDSSGNQISTFGGSGGTSVNEDVASADAQPGTPAYTVRNNTLTGATNADGDYQPQKSTAAGATYTAPSFGDVVAIAGNGATTTGTQRVTIANDSTGVLATVGTVTTVTTLTGTTTLTPGTAAANLGKAEDAVATNSGDTGVAILGHISGTPAATAADNDYGLFKLDLLGKAWISGAYPEDLAHATLDPLVAIGCIRRDTTPSSSSGTAADYSNCNVDANGRIYTNTVLYDAAGTALTPATDKAEDTAHTTADTGPVFLSRRIDTPATSSDTSGDYSTVNSGPEGGLYTSPVATAGVSAGASGCAVLSTASTNSTSCKGSAGNVYGMYLINTSTTVYYLRIYNSAAAPTCSSATGFIQSWPVPPAAASGQAGGFSFTFPVGRAYTTGIGYCLTGGSSSTDNTNAATGIFGEILYK